MNLNSIKSLSRKTSKIANTAELELQSTHYQIGDIGLNFKNLLGGLFG